MTALLGNMSVVDIVLLVLVIISLIGLLKVQRSTKKAMKEIGKEITSIQQYQGEISGDLNSKFASLKEGFDNEMQGFTTKFDELIKKVSATLSESKKAVMEEIEERTNPMKSSLNETRAAVRKILTDNEKELKRMSTEIEGFSKELQKMKDDIHERTFDLEL
jgi:methyl-accepting chemotaxis protein